MRNRIGIWAGSCTAGKPGQVLWPCVSRYSASIRYAFVNDGIAPARAVERRIRNMRRAGIYAECRMYPDIRNGFGLGTGTGAERWIERAMRFWKKHR